MKALLAQNNSWILSSEPFGAAQKVNGDNIRIKIMLAGLCRTDIMAMQGKIPLPNGRVLGHEGAGIVDFIPASQKSLATQKGIFEGTRVALFPFIPCAPCAASGNLETCHESKALGIDIDGLFAPYVHVPLSAVFKAPPRVSWKHLAYAEPVAAAMAVTKIHELKKPRVAILGSGRIALLTQQVLGAFRDDDVPVFSDSIPEDNWDCFVETRASSSLLKEACLRLRPGGLLVVKSRPQEPVEWPHALVTMRSLRISGASYGSFTQGLQWMSMNKINVAEALGQVFDWSEHGIESALLEEKNSSEKSGKLFFNIGGLSDEEINSVVSQ